MSPDPAGRQASARPTGERTPPASPVRAWRRRTPRGLLPTALSAIALAGTYAWNPELVRSTLTSPRALVFIVVVVAVVIAVGRLVGPRRPRLAQATQAALVVGVLAVTVLPSVRDTEVNEQLDVAVAPRSAIPSGKSGPDGSPPATAGPSAVASPSAPSATLLGEGRLRKLDYQASGRARLIELPSGRGIVRFENLDVQPGPDYVVYLVPRPDADEPDGGGLPRKAQGQQGKPELRRTGGGRSRRRADRAHLVPVLRRPSGPRDPGLTLRPGRSDHVAGVRRPRKLEPAWAQHDRDSCQDLGDTDDAGEAADREPVVQTTTAVASR